MLNRHKVNHKSGSPFGGTAQPSDYAATPAALVPPFDADYDTDGGDPKKEMCMLVVMNLSAFQDDELDPEQRRIIAAHLNNCPDCTQVFESLQETDRLCEREWRDEASLPSSTERRQAIDSIMDALPPVPSETPAFAPKRTHAKARWMRFATGISGLLLLSLSSWGSYRVGYVQGQASAAVPGSGSLSSSSRHFSSPQPSLLPAVLRDTQSPFSETAARSSDSIFLEPSER